MPRGVSEKSIPPLVIAGIESAFKSHFNWTHGDWLNEAPEYVVTYEVAARLAKLTHRWINLEYSVKQALSDAGSSKRGRKPTKLRNNGRADILLSRKSGAPWCVVEIKSPVYARTQIRADVDRVLQFLSNRAHGSSISCGALGFYSDAAKPQKKHQTAAAVLTALGERITAEARIAASTIGAGVILHAGKARNGEKGDAWQAFCLFFTMRKPRTKKQG